MRRALVWFLIMSFAVPLSARAIVFVPTAYLNIVVSTNGGDESFNFSLKSNQLYEPAQNFFISTSNGVGSFSTSVDFPNPGGYDLIEVLPAGWDSVSVNCTGTYNSISEGVHVWLSAYTTTNCVFSNNKGLARNPILIVPGIMGTEIFKETEKLWPDIPKMLKPFDDDSFMDPLSFNSDGNSIDNSLSIRQVVRNPDLLFNYTEKLINELEIKGYVEGVDLFTFPYDWRQDLGKIAHENLTGQIDYILNNSGAAKVDIIAHSQGGLVVKKLLYDLPEYQNKIGKLVFVGVPNLGAPKAAKVLLYGDSMDISFLGLGLNPAEVKKISQNMPAVYELLPSQEYFNHFPGYLAVNQSNSQNNLLGFSQTSNYLKSKNLNADLIDKANAFHAASYDNLDFSNGNMQVSNIVGCQTATLGLILSKDNGTYTLGYTAGDGTVPVFSASNIAGAQTYYSLNANHGTMLTQDGIRQQVVNLLTGSGDPTSGKISSSSSDCNFSGRQVSVHSPVELHIYDAYENHVGPTVEGGFDYNIPGVAYDMLGHDKFAFLPEGGEYRIKLVATGDGEFSFDSTQINSSILETTSHYDKIAINSASVADINIADDNQQVIKLDSDGNGQVDNVINPTAVLNGEQANDITSPITSVSLSGQMGEEGFYKGAVKISFEAHDEEINASGILKTMFSLDGVDYIRAHDTVAVNSEGWHKIKYFSVDKLGNTEQEKEFDFVIDFTPPEVQIQYNQNKKDLDFFGSDNISAAVKVEDKEDNLLFTDQAGNQTMLVLKEKERKKKFEAEIKQLYYNGEAADISKNSFTAEWSYAKAGQLKELEQNIKSKKDFKIEAKYNGKFTELKGKNAGGKIYKKIPDLVLLKLITNKGDFEWSY